MSVASLLNVLNPIHSIRARLLWLVALIGLTISLLLSYFVGTQSTTQVRNDRGVLLAEVASQMAHELDRGFFERYREIMIFSTLDPIRDPKVSLERKRALLEKLKGSYQDYAWIGITDAQGTILVGTDRLLEGVSVAKRDWFLKGSVGGHAGDVHDAFLLAKLLKKPGEDPLPLRLVDVSMPIQDDKGNVIGVICGHLSWAWADKVRSSMLQPLIHDRPLEVLVLNREGKILLGTAALPEKAEPLKLATVSAAQSGDNDYQIEQWEDGRDYLVGYARGNGYDYYPGLGWMVLVREDVGSAFAAAARVERNTLWISLGFAVVFIFLLWPVLTRGLRTMLDISHAAEQIRRGEPGSHIPIVEGDDEAAVLSASLRRLVVNLESQKAELQSLNRLLQEDMEQQRHASEELRLAAQVFNSSAEGIIITDREQRILKVNRAFSDITGYSEEEIVARKPSVISSGRHDAHFYQTMWGELKHKGSWQGEIWNRRKNGEIYPEWLAISSVRDEEGSVSHYVGIFSDITERKMAEDYILHLAHHDALTELPNRLLFIDRLRQAFIQSRPAGHKVALLFMDIDRFKYINDSLGHHVGDQLLQDVAQRLKECLEGVNTIARLGGDEFVIILGSVTSIDEVGYHASRIINAMLSPFEIGQHHLNVTVSIGIGIFPDDGEDVITLMKHADAAMYHAKEMGRNNYQFFTAAMNRRIQERQLLESQLRNAVARKELSLHYQPQVDLATGKIVGVESLLRWNNSELGEVPPARFIPVAEESGLIISLGKWALTSACQQLKQWEQEGISGIRLAVNFSPLQFRQTAFVECVEGVVLQCGLRPEQLEIEITETTLMESAEQTIANLNHLRDRGYLIAVDDFGTGYSSLSYLKRFPLDRIKIDQSFVRDIDIDSDDAAIVAAIIAMARNLGLKVIAEGVEKGAHHTFLMGLQCDEVQGYHYSPPLAASEVEVLLKGGTITPSLSS